LAIQPVDNPVGNAPEILTALWMEWG